MDKPRYPPGSAEFPPGRQSPSSTSLQAPPDTEEAAVESRAGARIELGIQKILHFLGECYGGPLAILNGLFLAVAATITLWPALQGPERYDEPILGVDSLLGGSKTGDLRAFFILIVLGTLFIVVCGWIVRKLRGDGSDPARIRTTNTILLLASIPFWAWLSRSAFAPLSVTPPGLAAAFTLIGLALVFALGRLRSTMDHPTLVRVGAMGLLTAFVSMMSGLGIATFVCRTPIGAERLAGSLNWVPWMTMSIGTVAFLFVLLHEAFSQSRELWLGKVLLIAQVPLPLLYFAVVTAPTLSPTGERFNETSITLSILVGLVAAACWFGWWRSWLARPRGISEIAPTLRRWMAPTALCAIAVFMSAAPIETPKMPYKGSLGAVPENGNVDDFHPAEALLPWQQWRNFGRIPFVDLMPPMGGRTIVMGFLNHWLFDGTFVGILAADNLLLAAGAAALFAAAWIVIGPAAALAVSLGVLEEGRLMPIIPVALLLAAGATFRRPLLWLYLYAGLGAVLLLYNPSVGVVLLAGAFPVALYQMYKSFLASPKKLALAWGTILVAAALVALSPLGSVFHGAVQFIAENAVGYVQSAGIPSEYSWTYPDRTGYPVGSMFAFEVLRSGWIVLAPLCVALLLRELSLPVEKRRSTICLFILLAVPQVLLLYNWALVRIAPDTWSRPGILTGIIVCQIVPLVLLARGRWWNGTLTVILLGAAASALEVSPILSGGVDAMNQRASAARRFASEQQIVRGAAVGIPSLGTCQAAPALVQRYVNLNQALSELLGPDETFFDLSNRGNIYIYANRRVPTPYSSIYYAPTRLLQQRMLDALRRDPVPLAVLAPAMPMDGNSSFRCYPLLRQFLLNDVAIRRDPWILLVDPRRAPQAGPIGSEAQLQLLDQALAGPFSNVQAIPIVWGQSWETMAHDFTMLQELTPLGSIQSAPPRVNYNLAANPIRGRDADFLLLHLQIRRAAPNIQPWVVVGWKPHDGPFAQMEFAAPLDMMYDRDKPAPPDADAQTQNVVAVVPLGCWPRWLLSPAIDQITIGIPDGKMVSEFSVTQAQLMKVNPLPGEIDH